MTQAATSAYRGEPGRVLVDPTRSGSAWKQVLVGACGVMLALLMIAGQVMVATTRGISANVAEVNANLETGNEVMFEIIEKAAPTPLLEKAVRQQQGTLAHTRDTLVLLNAELDAMLATTQGIATSSSRLESTSGNVASTIDAMAADAGELGEVLGPLPGKTRATNDSLTRIGSDSAAVSGEIGAIQGRLEGYGLPRAQGAPR